MALRKSVKKQTTVESLVRRLSAATGATANTYRVTLTGSPIGQTERQRATLRCLGLRRRGSTAIVPDTPQGRGRLRAVAHLIQVSEEA